MAMTTKAACEANTAGEAPCVCYDSCPTGPTYYPWFDDWSIANPRDFHVTGTQGEPGQIAVNQTEYDHI